MVYKEEMVAVVCIDGRIARETRSGEVFIPYGSDYSIMLKNLSTKRASVKVSIDGRDVLDDSSIVIGANSETEIKGFLEGNTIKSAFRFIEKTEQISEYRGDRLDDGLIRIEFAYEVPVYGGFKRLPAFGCWYENSPMCLESSSDPLIGTMTYCSSQLTDGAEVMRGITVKGEDVEQKFKTTYVGQLGESQVIVLQLRGVDGAGREIHTPVTTTTKLKCETCGTKSKSTTRFCPQCGTRLL